MQQIYVSLSAGNIVSKPKGKNFKILLGILMQMLTNS